MVYANHVMRISTLAAPFVAGALIPLMLAGRRGYLGGTVDRFGCLVELGWIIHYVVPTAYQVYKNLNLP